MQTEVLTIFRDRSSYRETITVPRKCPHCNETMGPIPKVASSNAKSSSSNEKVLAVLMQCSLCSKYYALEYSPIFENRGSGLAKGRVFTKYKIKDYNYRPNIIISFPPNIEKVSDKYVEIYREAATAESIGLMQIAGVGYRKAAEFLIKDYTIKNNREKEEAIKKAQLGQVISNYLNDFPQVQNLSTGVAWIGNDETHYVRRHTEKDINDMKDFLNAAALFISADYSAKNAEAFTESD